MKREVKNEANYAKFKRKMFLQSVEMVAIAFTVIGALYLFVLRGNVGEWLIWLFQLLFNMSWDEAFYLYHFNFRKNFNILFLGAVSVTLLIFLHFFLKRFTRYFDLINGGIDALIDNNGSDIVLIPDMEAIEKKLNTVRLTLEQRTQDAQFAEQRKNDLVMYLAHDIRTPLTSIIGYLSLLNETPEISFEQKSKHIHIALDKAYRLEHLIDEFFEITRLNSQSITLSKKTIDLYYMLVQISDEFYPQLAASGKQISVNATEDLAVYGDPDKLARVFNNILKNAIAYSDENSTIDITANLSGDIVSIVFKNTGTILQNRLSVIFDKFYRLDEARSTGTGGAGLGLAIAKEIVVLHGGNIFAESRDNQTSFTVELPAVS